MKTVSVSNSKGGVGKTTISLNIASELQFRGLKVALVDVDAQCDLTRVCINPNHQGPTIKEVLQKKSKVSDALVYSKKNNLYLLPGSNDLNEFNFSGIEYALRRVIKVLANNHFDFVLIDHPPGMHAASKAGFAASDHALIITEPESFSIDNLEKMIENIGIIQKNSNPALQIAGIIINKVDLSRSLTEVVLRECRSIFGKTIFHNIINVNYSVPSSQYEGIPLRRYRWRSLTVSQISDVTSELLKRMDNKNEHR